MTTSERELRSTGPMENWSVSRHLEDFYFGVTSFVKLSSPTSKVTRGLLHGRLVEAVKETFWSNFNFRTTIDFPSGKFLTLSPGETPIDITWYERNEENAIDSVLEAEVNKKFPDDQPLWRVWAVASDVEFETFEIGVTVHHAFADGLSSANLLHTFIRAFLASEKEETSLSEGPVIITYDPHTDAQKNELSSSVHTILPNSKPSIGVLLKEIATKILLPKFLRPKDMYWSGTKDLDLQTIQQISAKPKQYPTKIKSLSIPLDSLSQKCKLHGTTIHGALSTAAILATHVFKPTQPLKFATPINLRSHCEPPLSNDSIGVYVSELSTTHAPPKENPNLEEFWPMAIQFKEQLKGSLEPAIYTIGLMEYISDFQKFLHTERDSLVHVNGHKGSLEISNLGKQDWKDLPKTQFEIEELGFAQSTSVLSPVFTISAITWKNSCKLILSYLLDVNEAEKVTKFWTEFETILRSIS
ncbi:hypothetical protein K7432_007281 [Basidiobolus ranarum]|uniref:Alcohol acetyltransferase n=1 Tax=Basidiobolus ranarum TaxID=34480 RepID=A0ABR2W0B3_9FUNG